MAFWMKEKLKDGTEIMYDEEGLKDYLKATFSVRGILLIVAIPVIIFGLIFLGYLLLKFIYG